MRAAGERSLLARADTALPISFGMPFAFVYSVLLCHLCSVSEACVWSHVVDQLCGCARWHWVVLARYSNWPHTVLHLVFGLITQYMPSKECVCNRKNDHTVHLRKDSPNKSVSQGRGSYLSI